MDFSRVSPTLRVQLKIFLPNRRVLKRIIRTRREPSLLWQCREPSNKTGFIDPYVVLKHFCSGLYKLAVMCMISCSYISKCDPHQHTQKQTLKNTSFLFQGSAVTAGQRVTLWRLSESNFMASSQGQVKFVAWCRVVKLVKR